MSSKLILIVLVGLATVTAQQFRGDPFAFFRRFRPKPGNQEPPKPSHAGSSGAPTLAQARQFVESIAAAKNAMVDFESQLGELPQQGVRGCRCSQLTCQERTDQRILIFDMSQPCIILSPPGGVRETTCTTLKRNETVSTSCCCL